MTRTDVAPHGRATNRLPFTHFDELWHRGNLDCPGCEPRESSSLEGCLLSCSPSEAADEAWLSIAKLGGFARWLLTKPGGFRTLDLHRLSKATRRGLMADAIAGGLVEPSLGFRASYWDADDEARRYSLHASRRDAFEAVNDMERPRVVAVPIFAALPPLIEYWQSRHGGNRIDLLDVQDAAATWLIDHRHPDMDGVLWDDILDEYGLSAPRVGLFQRTVAVLERVMSDEG